MSRTPTDIIEVEFGEDTRYTPPPGADRWTAFRRTDIMGAMSEAGLANPNITYGGEPPTWAIMGGWNIAADQYIPVPGFTGSITAPATGFEHVASAAGFAVDWNTLASATASGLREALMVVAYENGRATHKTMFRVPAASAIDPTVIAAQERRLLQSLLLTRDHRAGSGGIIKQDHGEGSGEEFESLAVLDRRIAECRARIAWFEQAAEGNDLPGAAWAGLTAGAGLPAARTVAAAPSPGTGTTIMRAGFSDVIPHGQSTWRWVGTLNSIELDSTWSQPASFAIWIPGDLMLRVVAVVLLRSISPGTPGDPVNLEAFGEPQEYTFGNTRGMAISTPVSFRGRFSVPNDIRAILGETR